MRKGKPGETRTVTFRVRVKGAKKALFGWDAEFTDYGGHGFRSACFVRALIEHKEAKLNELLDVTAVTHRPGWKPKTGKGGRRCGRSRSAT